jgi:hypothetical protein
VAFVVQNTTFNQTFILVSSSDHVTPLTGASPTVLISKNASGFTIPVGAITEIGDGWYNVALAPADTNTVGVLSFHITATGGDPTDFSDQIVAAPVGPIPPTPPPVRPVSYQFDPSLGEVTIYAFNLCGIRTTSLTQEHMNSARMAANLVMMDWSNKGVNLWQVELVTVPFVQGTATYAVSPSVSLILDLYVTVTNGSASTNRYILPISRTEYASYANITNQGFPTTYWFDRLLSPSVTFWPVPDGNEASFSYYASQQIQDSAFTSGQQLDIPVIWMRAFAYALAAELGAMWAPDKAAGLSMMAEKLYNTVAEYNIETSAVYISPTVSSYWR